MNKNELDMYIKYINPKYRYSIISEEEQSKKVELTGLQKCSQNLNQKNKNR